MVMPVLSNVFHMSKQTWTQLVKKQAVN